MFRISTIDTPGQRRLVLEGKLTAPWPAEVEGAFRHATAQLEGRKLLIDLRNVTLISADGENTLYELMKSGAKFACADVLTKHVLRRLAKKNRCGL
jgi:hypothetical protein